MASALSSAMVFFVTLLAFSSFSSNGVSAQGNVTCASNFTNWYSDIVGETPCMTYYRLRSLCNSQYEVPSFRPNTPGDNCNDQVADCCCNSISWALSMLCMNCQQDVTGQTTTGIDAGVGAYELYLNNMGCQPNTNMSLPADVKAATCNKGVRLQNFLYGLFWNDGSWYYEYTTETGVTAANAAGSNTSELFTSQGCPTNMATTTSTASGGSIGPTSPSISVGSYAPSATQTSNGSSNRTNIGAAVGGAVGGAVGLAILAGLGVFCWRKRERVRRERVAYIESMAQRGARHAGGPSMSFTADHSQPTFPYSQSRSVYGGSSTGAPTSPPVGAAYAPVLNEEEDFGPLEGVGVSRAGTARLPPAYNHSWRESHRPGAGQESGDGAGAEGVRGLPQTPDERAARVFHEKPVGVVAGGDVGYVM